MDLSQIEKKLREAQFFLEHMIAQEKREFGDREPFDFYLSAFLNAARTVDYRLRHEFHSRYPDWRQGWEAGLHSDEQRLIKFMVDDRIKEVHQRGSSRTAKETSIPVSDRSVQVFSPESPVAEVIVPFYYFTIDSVERRAVDACKEYIRLLEKMVGKFKADHP